MKNDYTLSIIIPVYNTAKHLPICLDSILGQSFLDYEIIVINDCSEENIDEVMSPYLKMDNIKYIKLCQHAGPGGARNRGLDIARGIYIAFCDSDDWLDITYYEDSIQALNRQQADIAMCSLVRCYDYIQPNPLYKCKYEKEIILTGDYALKILTKQIDVGLLIIPSSVNKVYRKSYLDEIKLRFPGNTLFEDLFFSFIAIMHANKIVCVPNVSYHHYKRPNSIVQSFDKKHIDDFIKVFNLLRQYLLKVNHYEEYRFNYYKFLEQFYNLVVREIFEFVPNENDKKYYLSYSFQRLKEIINFEEYMEYTTAEQLRQHIQPHITDTTIY